MLDTDLSHRVLATVWLRRAQGWSGPALRARYSVGLALFDDHELAPGEKHQVWRELLRAIERTRPPDEPRGWEAS